GRDLGVAILWNSESSLPSGLLPTILDQAIGLPPKRWLDVDVDFGSDNLMVDREAAPPAPARRGTSPARATASPRSAARPPQGRRSTVPRHLCSALRGGRRIAPDRPKAHPGSPLAGSYGPPRSA